MYSLWCCACRRVHVPVSSLLTVLYHFPSLPCSHTVPIVLACHFWWVRYRRQRLIGIIVWVPTSFHMCSQFIWRSAILMAHAVWMNIIHHERGFWMWTFAYWIRCGELISILSWSIRPICWAKISCSLVQKYEFNIDVESHSHTLNARERQ